MQRCRAVPQSRASADDLEAVRRTQVTWGPQDGRSLSSVLSRWLWRVYGWHNWSSVLVALHTRFGEATPSRCSETRVVWLGR